MEQLNLEDNEVDLDISLQYDRTRLYAKPDGGVENIGNWRTFGRDRSDTPISASKIGEVLTEYSSNRLVLRLFQGSSHLPLSCR